MALKGRLLPLRQHFAWPNGRPYFGCGRYIKRLCRKALRLKFLGRTVQTLFLPLKRKSQKGFKSKKIKAAKATFWSRVRESNPPHLVGNQKYYRYTNPANIFKCFKSITQFLPYCKYKIKVFKNERKKARSGKACPKSSTLLNGANCCCGVLIRLLLPGCFFTGLGAAKRLPGKPVKLWPPGWRVGLKKLRGCAF